MRAIDLDYISLIISFCSSLSLTFLYVSGSLDGFSEINCSKMCLFSNYRPTCKLLCNVRTTTVPLQQIVLRSQLVSVENGHISVDCLKRHIRGY